MGRIATTEDVEGIRDQEDVDDEAGSEQEEDGTLEENDGIRSAAAKKKGQYVATLQEVHDAFDSVNTLRYSQPTHLQGTFSIILINIIY